MSALPPPSALAEIIERSVRSLDEIIATTTDLKTATSVNPAAQQDCSMALYYLKEARNQLVAAHFRLTVPTVPRKE